ncbi:uncharacterized protein [Lolium perenne]|uniref:uncharacterized protein n=1 Tax=Lolium perenne TaxID=4522 RepID=UPI0021F59218|nr:uncharacterized protein LOC127329092 [Lolium perenne]
MDLRQSLEMLRREVMDTSSDEESDETSQLLVSVASLIHKHNGRQMLVYWGSMKGRLANIKRNRVGVHNQLYKYYFDLTDPVYTKVMFRRLYRISMDLFLTNLLGIRDYDPYFQCRHDATGKLDFTSYQKCSSTISMLSYGVSGDIFDEYL